MAADRVPVVFIHGLWLNSTSWQPWAELFRSAGYDPVMPEWPGVPDTVAEARANPESQAGIGMTRSSTPTPDWSRPCPSRPS